MISTSYLCRLGLLVLYSVQEEAFAFVVRPYRATKVSVTTTLWEGADSNRYDDLMSTAREAFSGGTASDASDALMDASTGGDAGSVMSTFPPEVALAVVAIAVFGIGAAVLTSSGAGSGGEERNDSSAKKAAPKKEKEEPKPDLSIPYDSAARLAYNTWLSKQKEGTPDSEAIFQQFKAQYEEAAIMKVTAKKLENDLTNFDPSKPRPKPVAAAPEAEATNGSTNGSTATSSSNSEKEEAPFFVSS